MAIDLIIVLVSAVVYHDYESPLYAILVIYITSKVIDAVIYGSDSGTGKMMFIISLRTMRLPGASWMIWSAASPS